MKRLLAEHVDMQFEDVRTMLRLPAPGLAGGCNFAAASLIFNTIAGSSVCFYQTSEKAFTTRGDRSDRFKKLIEDFYPWEGESLGKVQAVELLYEAARNPLAHTLGLDAPPASGHIAREIALAKWALTEAEIAELEQSATRPAWAGPTLRKEATLSGVDRFAVSVPALYWGINRMLHALFADPMQIVNAEAVAKRFGPLWDKYISIGDAVTVSDADGVKADIAKRPPPRAPAE